MDKKKIIFFSGIVIIAATAFYIYKIKQLNDEYRKAAEEITGDPDFFN